MLKILQVRLQQYTNWELPDVQDGLKKRQRNQRSNCQPLLDHWKSKSILEKHLLLLHCLRESLWLCGSQQTGKFFKRWEYQTTLPSSLEICMQVEKLEWGMEQWTGSKLGKEFVKPVYCHPAYLTFMESTSCEMLGWMNHKLESRLLGEISATSDVWKVKRFKEAPWGWWKRRMKKLTKAQHSKNDHGIQSHHFMTTNRWGNNGNSDRLYILGLQIHCRWWPQSWN